MLLWDSDRFLKWMLHGGTNHLSKASVRLILHFIERRSVTSHHHGSTIFGWQQNQRQGRRKERGKKGKGFYWQKTNLHVHHAILFISLPWLHDCDMKLSNFKHPLHWVGEPTQKFFVFLFLNLDTVVSEIRSMKFEAVQILFLVNFWFVVIQKICYQGNVT